MPGEHEDVAFGFGSVWIPSEEGWITRLDPASLAVNATIPVAADPDFAMVASGSVWTTAYRGRAISRIDPGSNSVAATLTVRQGLQGIAFDGTSFWAATPLPSDDREVPSCRYRSCDPLAMAPIDPIPR